jgi:protein-disulfide isomerase
VTITRRDVLALASAASIAALAGVNGALAQEGTRHDVAKLLTTPAGLNDHYVGSETAPVTVVEYASTTCPHCGRWANEVYPAFKAAYIDTGKVRFLVRPFIRDVPDAVVYMLAEAAGPEMYHTVLETYFRTQEQWAFVQSPREPLLAIAKQLGFTDESFDAALTNQDLFNALEAARTQALDEFKLEGTPTFYVNGKQLTGEKTLEDLAAEIDPLIPADFVPTQPETPAATPAPTTTTVTPSASPTPSTTTVTPSASPAPTTTSTMPAGETASPVTPMGGATPTTTTSQ